MTVTLGKTSIGSLMEVGSDYVRGTYVVAAAQGKAISITAYLEVAGVLNAEVRCEIYDNANNLLGATERIDVPAGAGWKTFCFADNPDAGTDPDSFFPDGVETNGPWLTASQTYILCVWCSSGPPPGGIVRLYLDGGAMNESVEEALVFLSVWVPDPLLPTGYTARKYSLYATLEILNNSTSSEGNLKAEFYIPQGYEDLKAFFGSGYLKDWADLKAKFYVKLYRGPEDIKTDVWGAILVIDPNRQRASEPYGPIYLLLDNMTLKPGLTEAAGAFNGQINDNGCDHPELKTNPQYVYDKHTPYWLFEESSGWIRDDDEFWIGVQRGPGNDPWDPEPVSLLWNPVGGSDHKGSGRGWLLGGYISHRHYKVDADRKITAIIEGKCHMDVWKDQLFGTPSIPRNYTLPTDLKDIAQNLLSDVATTVGFGSTVATLAIINYAHCQGALVVLNRDGTISTLIEGVHWNRGASNNAAATSLAIAINALTGVSATALTNMVSVTEETFLKIIGTDVPRYITCSWMSHNYRAHPLWFPTIAIGTTWIKEFKQDDADNVMKDICSAIADPLTLAHIPYEWRIDYKKYVLLYERGYPHSDLTSPDITFSNIRNMPEVCVGDTTERVTHVISTDASSVTIPPDIDMWSIMPGHWLDRENPNRVYIGSTPFPPNPKTGAFVDPTLVFDDEGHPALAFMKDRPFGLFNIDLCLVMDTSSDEWKFSRLHMDLRIWRKVKFRFRHVSRMASGSTYLVRIQTGVNDFYSYDFTSSITDSEWTSFDIDLPEPNSDGSENPDKLKGWIPYKSTPSMLDPTDINFVNFRITCGETPTMVAPPYMGMDLSLSSAYDPAVDKDSCSIDNPERLGGLKSGYTQPLEFFWPQYVTFEPGAGSEEGAQINGVNIADLPTGNNVLLRRVLNSSHAGGSTVRLRMGWAVSLSQIHFERNIRVEGSAASIHPPYRYRMMVSKEMDSLEEATVRADTVINEESLPRQFVRAIVDGDPRFIIGKRSRVVLPMSPFTNIHMVLDDVEYRLDEETDLVIEATCGLTTQKARQLNEISIIEAHERHILNIGLGKVEVR